MSSENQTYKTTYDNYGDVNIQRLDIVSGNGSKSVSLLAFLENIVFTEDIFTDTMRGEVSVNDTVDLLTDLPIIGEEIVVMSYSIPGKGKILKRVFSVYDVVEIQPTPIKKSRSYVLKIASAEQVANTYKRVNKAFDEQTSTAVESILSNDLGTGKKIEVESTAGTHRAIIPKWSPFKAIRYMAKKSVASDSSASAFLFFENTNGFNFKSVSKIIQDGLDNYDAEQDTYTHILVDDNNNIEQAQLEYRNIISLNVAGPANSVNKLRAGGFKSSVKQLDLLNKTVNEFTFEYSSDKDSIKTGLADKDPNTDLYSEAVSENDAVELFVSFDADNENDSTIAEVIPKRLAQLAHLRNFKLAALVAGDTRRKAGDVVEIIVPKITGLTLSEHELQDKLYSGKYLVSAVKHSIQLNKYYMTMNLLRIESNRKIDNA